MYRMGVGLGNKLRRMESAGGAVFPTPTAPERAATLEELRARMKALLDRSAPATAPRTLAPLGERDDLPFVTRETPGGPLHLRVRRLSAAHRTGRAGILPARDASAELLALLALDPSLAACDVERALYLDTETTGLHGGTGTIAFLVGLAFWEDGGLVVEQVLVRQLGEERPMLEHVAERIRSASMLVTFNGKSFDLPLLRTRFLMGRLTPPTEPPHLDLVHVARRLHKARGIVCRLTTLEQRVLGFERIDDVPGGEVSACYLHFLRTGEAGPLLGVIDHNAWDVVAMAALVGLYGEPLDGSRLEPEDLVGVARTLLRAGERERAFDTATAAVERGGGHASLRARADIAKARGDRARALVDFETLASQVDDGNVRLELAKLYEHHVKAPARALDVVLRGTSEAPEQASKRAHRLERKLARSDQKALFDAPGPVRRRTKR
jgi:uncharacterized protein YprB with RNaseH-like and TPR domain